MASNKDFVFRFAVGKRGGARSSIWRVWFNKPECEGATSDVYFSYRTLGGIQKLSFHQSGEIRFAYTREFAEKHDMENPDRLLDKWQVSYTQPLFKVIIPYTELRAGQDREDGKINYLPSPDIRHAIEVYVYITAQSLQNIMPDSFSILLEENLANGNMLSLLWRNNPITESNSQLYMSGKIKLQNLIVEQSITGKDLRGSLFINNQGNERGFIDLAL